MDNDISDDNNNNKQTKKKTYKHNILYYIIHTLISISETPKEVTIPKS